MVYAVYLRILYIVEFTLCYNIHAIPIITFPFLVFSVYSHVFLFLFLFF